MANETSNAGLENWGTGPSSSRPKSIGQHDPIDGKIDENAKPIDPDKDYNGQPGDNKGMGIKDGPGGPVTIGVKK